MIFDKVVVGPMQCNCYILGCFRTKKAIIVDPGAEPEKIKQVLLKHKLTLEYIVNTHGHVDHIGANADFGVPIYIHCDDADFLSNPHKNLSSMLGSEINSPKAEKCLKDGQEIIIGDLHLNIIHTPGHTPGGICLCAKEFCLTGDTLFAQGVGRTDFPYSDEKLLHNSLSKLFRLDDDVAIYPGHGPSSTIGEERRYC